MMVNPEKAGQATLGLAICSGLMWLVFGGDPWTAPKHSSSSMESPASFAKFSRQDRDWMTRTVWAESLGESYRGQVMVAHVIKNRWIKSPYPRWKTISKVVSACGYITRRGRKVKVCQFEPWLWKATKRRMFALNANSKSYRHYRKIVDGVLDGTIPDNVGGRRCFMNAQVVRLRRGTLPVCRTQDCLVEQRHTFYRCKGWERL